MRTLEWIAISFSRGLYIASVGLVLSWHVSLVEGRCVYVPVHEITILLHVYTCVYLLLHLLYCISQTLYFLQIEGSGQPCIKQVYLAPFFQ